MFEAKLSKEEVNEMPTILFEGKITLVDELSKVAPAIEYLRKSPVVGIDTETRPSFTRGVHYKISLVQIANLEQCFLFRLNKIGFPKELADFLADDSIKKVGLAVREDLAGLNRIKTFRPQNVVEIQSIVNNYGILELGLQKIFAILFGRKISKSQRLTNWESDVLNDMQQKYAATDAWATLLIYLQLINEQTISKKEIDALKFLHNPMNHQQAIKGDEVRVESKDI